MKALYRHLSTRQLYVLGAIVPLLCAVLIGSLQWESVSDLMKNRDLVRHSRNIQLALGVFRYSLSDAESCQFRYILNHNPVNLELYRQLVTATQAQLVELRSLIADNPLQQKFLANIEPLLREKLRLTDESLSREQNGDHAGALQMISTDDSRVNMLAIEANIENMRTVESHILFQRQNVYQHRLKLNALVSACSMTLCMLCLIGIILLLRRLAHLQSSVTLSALSQMVEYEGGMLTIEDYLKKRREALYTHGEAQVEAERILALLGKTGRKSGAESAP